MYYAALHISDISDKLKRVLKFTGTNFTTCDHVSILLMSVETSSECHKGRMLLGCHSTAFYVVELTGHFDCFLVNNNQMHVPLRKRFSKPKPEQYLFPTW